MEAFDKTWTALRLSVSGLIAALAKVRPFCRNDALANERRLLEAMVEDRTRAFDEARRRAETLALVARAANDPTLILDEGGRVIWANETHLRMSGHSPDELFGRRADTLFAGPGTDLAVVADIAMSMAAGRGHRCELVQYAIDGTPYVLDISITPAVDPETGNLRWIAVGRDISARKELERSFEAGRAQAEEANKAKSTFLANMSQELRTPLNAMIGYSEIPAEDLRAHGLTESTDDAERIRAAARHLLALINEVLDLSKIEAGRMELSIADVDGAAIMRDMIDAVALAAREAEVEIVADIDSALAQLRTDQIKLRQCLLFSCRMP
jgi:PAS domain S-box-containing protein